MRCKARKSTAVSISIVVPTLNEEKYLPLLLSTLQRQTFRNFEIIVADAGSTDSTVDIARSANAIVVKGGKPAVGRNHGAAAADGKHLFFLDADVVLPDDFLERVWEEIHHKDLNLATCAITPLSNLPIDKVLHGLTNLSIKLMQYSGNPHAPGFCILVSRDIFERVGGFDESLYLAEDHEFVKRAAKLAPMRVLTSTNIFVSVRRLRKEGRFTLATKYLQVELHRLFNREIRNEIMNYEFGAHDGLEMEQDDNGFGELVDALGKLDDNMNAAIAHSAAAGGVATKRVLGPFRRKLLEAKEEFLKQIHYRRRQKPERGMVDMDDEPTADSGFCRPGSEIPPPMEQQDSSSGGEIHDREVGVRNIAA